ncbi:MAG: hypothetical protein ACREAC_32025, partial [Blastocatellia bacterium]
MSEHISNQLVNGYQQGKLAPEELLSVGEHLAECLSCREQMTRAHYLPQAYSAIAISLQAVADEHPAHLSPEQMATYVDKRLDGVDLTTADRHLEVCSDCYVELLELRRLKPVLKSFGPSDPSLVSEPVSRRKPAFGTRLWVRKLPVQAAAVFILLFGLTTVLRLRTEVTQLNSQITALQKTNSAIEAAGSDSRNKIESFGETPDSSGTSTPAAVVLKDGTSVVTLDGQGGLAGFKSLPKADEQLVRAALKDQRVGAPPVLAELVQRREALLGAGNGHQRTFSLVSPLGMVVETDRPTFRWRPLDGAGVYSVTVRNSSSKEVIVSPCVAQPEWTPTKPLERGALYAWEVTATRGGKEVTVPITPMPQARFFVLEQSKLDELKQSRRKYAGSKLMLGIIYARAGLLDEAKHQLAALVAANPDSVTAHR